MGYDTFMVAVNTSLDVAKKRNKDRLRALPEKVLVKSWSDVQNNLGAFQGLFKSNYRIVDNSKFLEPKQAQAKFAKIMGAGLDKFVTKPVKNPIGQKWVQDQFKLKKAGIK